MADRELNANEAGAALSKVFAQKLRVSEKAEQAHGVQLLRAIGATVYVLGGHRRKGDYQGTMQTEGLSDVEAFLPPRFDPTARKMRRLFLKWECKVVGGRLRPAQKIYQQLCEDADVAHLVGPFDALIAWLAARDYVKASAFPHYRQPQGAQTR